MSWNINAYVEERKKSFLKRFKRNSEKISQINNNSNAISIDISNSNDDSTKHILKNGINLLFSNYIWFL